MSYSWRKLDCLGVLVSQPRESELREWFLASAQGVGGRGGPRTLYFANAHTLNLAARDKNYRAVLNRADAVLNDGAGLELYGRLAGAPFKANFNGTDLIPRLLAAADEPLSLFLFGAKPGRAEQAANRIVQDYPNIRVVGTRHGFSQERVVAEINAARPDVLLVGLGNPNQELWIDANREQLETGLAIGVGALIDFVSGAVPRAPSLLRHLRLEWIYRLAREPRRLFGRYVVGNPVFVARSLVYLASARRRPQP